MCGGAGAGQEERVSSCASNNQNWSLLEFQGILEEHVAESKILGQASLLSQENTEITIGKYVVKGR